jgi:hypothetical protein
MQVGQIERKKRTWCFVQGWQEELELEMIVESTVITTATTNSFAVCLDSRSSNDPCGISDPPTARHFQLDVTDCRPVSRARLCDVPRDGAHRRRWGERHLHDGAAAAPSVCACSCLVLLLECYTGSTANLADNGAPVRPRDCNRAAVACRSNAGRRAWRK